MNELQALKKCVRVNVTLNGFFNIHQHDLKCKFSNVAKKPQNWQNQLKAHAYTHNRQPANNPEEAHEWYFCYKQTTVIFV